MEAPDALSIFTIDDDFMNQWFDSFHPSVKTYVTDFVIHKLKRYDFDPDPMEGIDDKGFAIMVLKHFDGFLKLKMMESNPGRIITGYKPLATF